LCRLYRFINLGEIEMMCQNSNLDTLVCSVVNEFVRDGVLFTALDVSNKVKENSPLSRHRDVRDIVRRMWSSDIEINGYGRTPITVNLNDGSTAEALLYHPLSDSWDLDAKYDAQKRAQSAIHAATSAPKTVSTGTNVIGVASDGTINVMTLKTITAATTDSSGPTDTQKTNPIAVPSPTQPNARDLWDQLFKSQPSLFPRR
jgi:hypothetical protein